MVFVLLFNVSSSPLKSFPPCLGTFAPNFHNFHTVSLDWMRVSIVEVVRVFVEVVEDLVSVI